MSKPKTDVIENFGERLAQLRKAAGYTQVEFAAEVGITLLLDTFIEREKLKQRVNAQGA